VVTVGPVHYICSELLEAKAVRAASIHVGYKAFPELILGEPLHRYSCKVILKSQVPESIVADMVTLGPVNCFCSELLEAKLLRVASNHVGYKAFPEMPLGGQLHR
jgi:hypothetical protein